MKVYEEYEGYELHEVHEDHQGYEDDSQALTAALHVIVSVWMLLRAMTPKKIKRLWPLTTFPASTGGSIACDGHIAIYSHIMPHIYMDP